MDSVDFCRKYVHPDLEDLWAAWLVLKVNGRLKKICKDVISLKEINRNTSVGCLISETGRLQNVDLQD